MAIYLELDGIKGSSTDEAFKDQIECQSFQWGAGIGVGSARGGDRSHSEPSISEISVTKNLDKSSELLFKALLKGDVIKTGKVSFTAASAGESVAYHTIALKDVIISGYSQSSGGDFPVESISLNIAHFDASFTGRDTKQVGQATHLIYDLSTNKVG